jgi:ArsR family transcriptional regulator
MGRATTPDLSRTARWFHALADQTRLQIIERLCSGEQCVCDLTDSLQTGQSRLSFHLKTLKDAGLLLDRREGRWVYYSLNPEALDEMIEALRSMKVTPAKRTTVKCCD